jgi:uncharacterized OsmC-like protein
MPLHYRVHASRLAPHVGMARAKQAQVFFDVSPDQSDDLLNPAELLLSSLAACMLKNVERLSPVLRFSYTAVALDIEGTREDRPPRMTSISYTLHLWTDEPPTRVDLLHRNLQQHGTIYNTLAATVPLQGHVEVHATAEREPVGETVDPNAAPTA